VANGTLNLKVGEQFGLRPFNRDDLLTAGSDIVYDEVAKWSVWIEFLDLIFNGNRDIIRWVQKFCGYCMTGDIGEQIFTILWGSGSKRQVHISVSATGHLGHRGATAAAR